MRAVFTWYERSYSVPITKIEFHMCLSTSVIVEV